MIRGTMSGKRFQLATAEKSLNSARESQPDTIAHVGSHRHDTRNFGRDQFVCDFKVSYPEKSRLCNRCPNIVVDIFYDRGTQAHVNQDNCLGTRERPRL
jgi:hypothetical protein